MNEPQQVPDAARPRDRIDGSGTVPARLIALYEPIIALATTAKVCGYQLAQEAPDLSELRELVARMIASADHAITICRNENFDAAAPAAKTAPDAG